jgi:hypothetical protein
MLIPSSSFERNSRDILTACDDSLRGRTDGGKDINGQRVVEARLNAVIKAPVAVVDTTLASSFLALTTIDGWRVIPDVDAQLALIWPFFLAVGADGVCAD